jgi:hypothetical protein
MRRPATGPVSEGSDLIKGSGSSFNIRRVAPPPSPKVTHERPSSIEFLQPRATVEGVIADLGKARWNHDFTQVLTTPLPVINP